MPAGHVGSAEHGVAAFMVRFFWSWLFVVDSLLCLFISINGPSGQDLYHLFL